MYVASVRALSAKATRVADVLRWRSARAGDLCASVDEDGPVDARVIDTDNEDVTLLGFVDEDGNDLGRKRWVESRPDRLTITDKSASSTPAGSG